MRHHILVHEVDLKFIEQAKAKRESEQVPEVEKDPAPFSLEGKEASPHVRLWSLLRSIDNQRIQVVRLVVVLWLKYIL